MRYEPETHNAVKREFIEQGKSPAQISIEFGGNPSKSTIINWAGKEDQDGKTWYDLRQEFIRDSYDQATPHKMARKILEKIGLILHQADFTTKDADALSKLQRSLEKITEPRHQVPVMYEMLESLVTFLQDRYGHLVNEELLNAIRDFKNDLRKRLT